MKKNSYMALLLALLMVATLVGCSSGVQNGTSDKPSDTTSNQTILQEATEWFKEQTTYYEIISSEVCGEQIIFLTGTKNPGTDDYQNLQAFVVKQTDGDYEVAAMKDGERGVSAGFSAHVLATDALTIYLAIPAAACMISLMIADLMLILRKLTSFWHRARQGQKKLLEMHHICWCSMRSWKLLTLSLSMQN